MDVGIILLKIKNGAHTHKKINWKWIKGPNVRTATMKLQEENKGKMFLDIGLGSDFLEITLKAQATELKNK